MTKKSIISVICFIVITLFLPSCTDKKTSIKAEKSAYSTVISKEKPFHFLPKSKNNQIVYHNYYVLSYVEKYEQAEWVAYELKKEHLVSNNFERPFFVQDKKVVTGSADWRNYKFSGYDKGHLCPAGDRKFSKKAFDETFLTSNCSPQKHDFNDGVWNRLEQKVRYWVTKYNQLYVVTGGVLSNDLKRIGKEKVVVPNYFYKIILHKSGDSYKMIAFLVPHQESEKPLYQFVVSTDSIEKLTGIDFFPKLNDKIENQLEKKTDYKDWIFN